jgi:hypothetical protein
MKKKLIAAGAAGLTVATVIAGLSFGETAFSAAYAPESVATETISRSSSPQPLTTGGLESRRDGHDAQAEEAPNRAPSTNERSATKRMSPSASKYKMIFQASE